MRGKQLSVVSLKPHSTLFETLMKKTSKGQHCELNIILRVTKKALNTVQRIFYFTLLHNLVFVLIFGSDSKLIILDYSKNESDTKLCLVSTLQVCEGTFSLLLLETIDQALIRVGPCQQSPVSKQCPPIDAQFSHRSKTQSLQQY